MVESQETPVKSPGLQNSMFFPQFFRFWGKLVSRVVGTKKTTFLFSFRKMYYLVYGIMCNFDNLTYLDFLFFFAEIVNEQKTSARSIKLFDLSVICSFPTENLLVQIFLWSRKGGPRLVHVFDSWSRFLSRGPRFFIVVHVFSLWSRFFFLDHRWSTFLVHVFHSWSMFCVGTKILNFFPLNTENPPIYITSEVQDVTYNILQLAHFTTLTKFKRK